MGQSNSKVKIKKAKTTDYIKEKKSKDTKSKRKRDKASATVSFGIINPLRETISTEFSLDPEWKVFKSEENSAFQFRDSALLYTEEHPFSPKPPKQTKSCPEDLKPLIIDSDLSPTVLIENMSESLVNCELRSEEKPMENDVLIVEKPTENDTIIAEPVKHVPIAEEPLKTDIAKVVNPGDNGLLNDNVEVDQSHCSLELHNTEAQKVIEVKFEPTSIERSISAQESCEPDLYSKPKLRIPALKGKRRKNIMRRSSSVPDFLELAHESTMPLKSESFEITRTNSYSLPKSILRYPQSCIKQSRQRNVTFCDFCEESPRAHSLFDLRFAF